jgi:HTH-type transcriptional regulator/antitoxin HigA
MNKLKPARLIPPGRILERELTARGWTQAELAKVLGRPKQVINEIIHAKKRITPETALELGAALGVSAEFWLNLETTYRLRLSEQQMDLTEIQTRRTQLELSH